MVRYRVGSNPSSATNGIAELVNAAGSCCLGSVAHGLKLFRGSPGVGGSSPSPITIKKRGIAGGKSAAVVGDNTCSIFEGSNPFALTKIFPTFTPGA